MYNVKNKKAPFNELKENISMQVPTYLVNKVWHVGEMDISMKVNGSHEGSGLSVSECPKAWEFIAKCGGRSFNELVKTNGEFLDYHKLTEEDIQTIIQWGIKAELITLRDMYKYIFYNENGDEVYGLCDSYEEALSEVDGEEEFVQLIPNQPKATDKMKTRVTGDAAPVLVIQLITILYTEDMLELDGVWFHDDFSPYNYSAPRGVISPLRISAWKRSIVSEDDVPQWSRWED